MLITILDDVYDIYGTLDELELFADAIERFVQLIRDEVHLLCSLKKFKNVLYKCIYITCAWTQDGT